jgi:hypothetical protein
MRLPSALAAAVTVVALCLSRGVLPLPAQNSSPYVEPVDILRGTVINSVTREPIGRALVFSPDNRFAVMTDDQGRFEFTFLRERRENGAQVGTAANLFSGRPNTLSARKPGFLDMQRGQQAVPVGPEQQKVTISLVPEAAIVGRVLVSNSEFERIQVELYRQEVREGEWYWQQAGTATTRINGEFRFAGLPSGKYKLLTREILDRDPLTFDPRGQLFGYPPIYYPVAKDFASAELISMTAGKTFHANLSPGRQRYYPVKVRIINPPAAGAQVQVWPEGNVGPGYSLGYDPGEEVIQGLLPDGNYEVHVATYGQEGTTGATRISVHGVPLVGPTITLLPNASVAVKIREELQHPEAMTITTVDGPVISENERRLSYLSLRLLPAGGLGFEGVGSPGPPKSSNDDSLVIENVQPGRYRVKATSGVGFVSSITAEGKDLRRQLLEVNAGGAMTQIEITIRDDGAEVEGTVEVATSNGAQVRAVSSPGQPVGVYFVPEKDGTGQFRVVWLSLGGKFQLQQLPPGDYRVLAFDRVREDLEYASEDVLRQYDSRSQMIHVVAGQKEHLQLRLITENE